MSQQDRVRNPNLSGQEPTVQEPAGPGAPSMLGERFRRDLCQIWINFNALRGRSFLVLGLAGPGAAAALADGGSRISHA